MDLGKRRKLRVAAIAAFAVAAGIAFHLARERRPEAPAPVQTATVANQIVPAGRIQPAAKPAVASDALPPADAPLRASFETLDRQARRGNAQAACRLAAELRRCGEVWKWTRERDQLAQGAAAFGLDTMRGAELENVETVLGKRRAVLDAAFASCEGVDRAWVAWAPRYVAMAAQAGHVPSQIDYPRGEQLNPAALLENPALLNDYRANAHRYFTNALQAGDLAVLQAWRTAAHWDQAALRAFLPEAWRDPALIEALVARLTPEQQISAFPTMRGREFTATPAQERIAAELHARYFADSPPLPRYQRPPDEGNETVVFSEKLSLVPMRCDEAPR